jgi:hypothetical protein
VFRTSVLNLSKQRVVRLGVCVCVVGIDVIQSYMSACGVGIQGVSQQWDVKASDMKKGGRLPDYSPEVPVFVTSIQTAPIEVCVGVCESE